MVAFDLWKESFIFALVYGVLIIVPCVLVALMGRKMIGQLGQWPTQTPAIQMSIIWKLILIEVVTFSLLIGFFNVFAP